VHLKGAICDLQLQALDGPVIPGVPRSIAPLPRPTMSRARLFRVVWDHDSSPSSESQHGYGRPPPESNGTNNETAVNEPLGSCLTPRKIHAKITT
jgi:hypothetical protein